MLHNGVTRMEVRVNGSHPVKVFLALCLCAVAAPVLATDLCPRSSYLEPQSMRITELKTHYLQCDARSTAARLETADYKFCGEVAEFLKQKAFGGDLEKQLAWRRGAQQVASRPASQ